MRKEEKDPINIDARNRFYDLYQNDVEDTTAFVEFLMRFFDIREVDVDDRVSDSRFWVMDSDAMEAWKKETRNNKSSNDFFTKK
jgi:hypothetical protein